MGRNLSTVYATMSVLAIAGAVLPQLTGFNVGPWPFLLFVAAGAWATHVRSVVWGVLGGIVTAAVFLTAFGLTFEALATPRESAYSADLERSFRGS